MAGLTNASNLRATVAPQRKILPNLTAARIFAAAWVLIYHAGDENRISRQAHWYHSWIDGGYLGVSFFFVLSGFILVYNAPAILNPRKFYILRFARIYPLYVVSLLCCFPNFLTHSTGPHLRIIGVDLLLIQIWFSSIYRSAINGPAWSLCAEAFFYLSFPLLLTPLRKSMQHWKLLLVVLAVLAILPASAAHIWLWHTGLRESAGMIDVLAWPLFRLCEFAIGMILGLLFISRQSVISGRTTALALLLSLATVGLLPYIPYEVMRCGVLALPFGFLVYCLAGWKSNILASPPMQLLGEISYGVYLLQTPLALLIGKLVHWGPQLNTILFITILPVSYFFYLVVEKPGRRIILHLFGVRSHPKPIQTPDPATP